MTENADISKLLSGIMSDPETLSKVMNLASELKNQSGKPQSEPAFDRQETNAGGIDLSKLTGALGGSFGDERAKNRVKLLSALKPYMQDSRSEKIDFIIKMLGVLEAVKTLSPALYGESNGG